MVECDVLCKPFLSKLRSKYFMYMYEDSCCAYLIPESVKEQHRYYITCGLYTSCYIVKYMYMYIVYTSLDVICQLTLIYCIYHIQDVQLSDS